MFHKEEPGGKSRELRLYTKSGIGPDFYRNTTGNPGCQTKLCISIIEFGHLVGHVSDNPF